MIKEMPLVFKSDYLTASAELDKLNECYGSTIYPEGIHDVIVTITDVEDFIKVVNVFDSVKLLKAEIKIPVHTRLVLEDDGYIAQSDYGVFNNDPVVTYNKTMGARILTLKYGVSETEFIEVAVNIDDDQVRQNNVYTIDELQNEAKKLAIKKIRDSISEDDIVEYIERHGIVFYPSGNYIETSLPDHDLDDDEEDIRGI